LGYLDVKWLKVQTCHLDSVMVSMLAERPKVHGVRPGQCNFKGVKNPWHTFLRRGSKTVSPISLRFYSMFKNSTNAEEIFCRQTPSFPLPRSYWFAVRWLCW